MVRFMFEQWNWKFHKLFIPGPKEKLKLGNERRHLTTEYENRLIGCLERIG